jgi:hypothetical protein
MISRRRAAAALVAAAALTPLTLVAGAAARADTAPGDRQGQYAAAAREFGVPAGLLLALSYNETRWDTHQGTPSVDGGYGPLHLTDLVVAQPPAVPGDAGSDAKGDDANPPAPAAEAPAMTAQEASAPALHTATAAAALTGASLDAVKTDPYQNIRGGAALLASYARDLNGGALPADAGDWYAAVARYSGADNADSAAAFADDVYATLRSGAARDTDDGQAVKLAADSDVTPDKSLLGRLRLPHVPDQTPPECPQGLACHYVPAAYTQTKPGDPTAYGNYDWAHRPTDMRIQYIVIHDMEGYYQGSINWFQNPAAQAAAHYLVRSSDGDVTQMIKTSDVAWQAGNWYINSHSIGIEHEGFAQQGGTWYTEAMYRASAKLVRFLAHRYGVPLDRAHIIGHDNVPGLTDSRVGGMHWDPSAYWDWAHYMDLLGAPIRRLPLPDTGLVTIDPDFATNQPPVTGCTGCVAGPLPPQPTDFVYLRTQPSDTAPLLNDPYLHPDGSPGTTVINDWSAKAVTGQQYAVAGRRGDWTGIWYAGQVGWFRDPRHGAGKVSAPALGLMITPKAGLTSIPVYGKAYPEAAAYAGTPIAPVSDAAYTKYVAHAGERYTLAGYAPTEYYYAPTIDASRPGDHTVVHGKNVYLEIQYAHRIAFVNAADVQLVWPFTG